MTTFVKSSSYPKADEEILVLALCGVNGLEWSTGALKFCFLLLRDPLSEMAIGTVALAESAFTLGKKYCHEFLQAPCSPGCSEGACGIQSSERSEAD